MLVQIYDEVHLTVESAGKLMSMHEAEGPLL